MHLLQQPLRRQTLLHRSSSRNRVLLGVSLFLLAQGVHAQETRIKDLTNIRGVRSNSLVGYGIVIGLGGTGDSASAVISKKAVASMLTHMGIHSAKEDIVPGNYASVIATAELPPFAKIGDRIDVRISANSDAKSLAGGTLISTPLQGGDGHTYSFAQGPVVVGQATGSGPSVLTVARVPSGGSIEREFVPNFAPRGVLTLSLLSADFTTNNRIALAINHTFKGFYALSTSPASIEVRVPPLFSHNLIAFVAELENITVNVENKSIVVLNERTGTVVLGNDVQISPVTIAHGDLSIVVEKEKHAAIHVSGSTVGELIQALNQLGAKPQDLGVILQTLHAAGALHGEIKIL
jgi:flagellar P-ring protein precursor FlgI